jgi:hypothetical protein
MTEQLVSNEPETMWNEAVAALARNLPVEELKTTTKKCR